MTIDLLVGETLDRKLADVRVPRVDVAAARALGRRRRRRRAGILSGVVFVAAFGTTAAILAPSTPTPDEGRSTFPAMDFALGAHAVYDAQTGQVSLGGHVATLDDAADLGAGAVATPYGLVYFTADQAVRFVGADGQVRTLAPAPARPESFTPTVRFDNSQRSVAWLTRSNGEVTLSVYSLDPLQLVGSFPVPCDGDCRSLRMGGHDQGLAFVSGDGGSRVIDPSAGPRAKWSEVTGGHILDVRFRTILSEEPSGAEPEDLSGSLGEGWRLEPATIDHGMLTSDGSWELGPDDTVWRSLGGQAPFQLPIPEGTGPVKIGQDSDGTPLVRRTEAGDDVYYDCDYFLNCTEFARFDGANGRSGLVGNVR